jgi:hypothetical protein
MCLDSPPFLATLALVAASADAKPIFDFLFVFFFFFFFFFFLSSSSSAIITG